MVNNRTIQIRLSKDQYERIKNYSRMKGFTSLSGYLRFVALDQDFLLQQKIYEIHRDRKNKTHFSLNRSESQDRQTPLEHPPSAAGGAVEPEPGEPVNQVSVGILSWDGYRLEAKLDTS